MKETKFELKKDGSVEKVGPFGSYGPTVNASNKTEAMTKFLAFAFRAIEKTPVVKIRNGAYQLAYESLNYGITVEAGIDERKHPLCFSGVASWDQVNDGVASFDYYASPEYRSMKSAA